MGATSAETCMYGTCEQSEKETHRSLSDWFRSQVVEGLFSYFQLYICH